MNQQRNLYIQIYSYLYIYIFQFGEYLSTFQHPSSNNVEPQTAKKLFVKLSHQNNWLEEEKKLYDDTLTRVRS